MLVRIIPLLALVALLTGCGGPKLTQSGFLSTYDNLEKVGANRMEFVSDVARDYDALVLDPIEVHIEPEERILSDAQRLDVLDHFHDRLAQLFEDKGFIVVESPGPRVAHVRLAITDIHKSTWWLNLHPGSKLSGIGLGGASMEGEVVDSITGAQLAAVIQAGKGNQFELDTFSGVDDVKDVINIWVRRAGQRIDEIRADRAAVNSP